MKKLIALLVVGIVVFVAIERQRLFLRDPLATVTRNDVKVSGVAVMINYSNDVLLDDTSDGKHRIYLVQGYNKVAGTPTAPLQCIQGMVCRTDADRASMRPLPVKETSLKDRMLRVTMTPRQVEFRDEDGVLVGVSLR